MKTAVYIEDGVTQFVLSPETDFERTMMRMMQDGDVKASVFSGSFYDCRGGWIRQSEYRNLMDSDSSLVVRLERPASEEVV